jgi:hypothetical protein
VEPADLAEELLIEDDEDEDLDLDEGDRD